MVLDVVIRKDEHKHLGLILDSKLTFTSHMRQAIFKARRGIGMIKHLSKYVARDVLDQVYKLYVRPVFTKSITLHCSTFLSKLLCLNSLTLHQSGFQPNDSTIIQLPSITHKIYCSFDNVPSLETRAVFLDLSKALDRE